MTKESLIKSEQQMHLHVTSKKTVSLHGHATIPGSKSHSIRALFLALLAKGESTITNLLQADDTRCAISICQQLGADIVMTNNQTKIKSNGPFFYPHTRQLNSGNSGVTTHFTMPLLGLCQQENTTQPVILHCGSQMQARPVQPLITALTNLGLSIHTLEKPGTLPIAISGSLRGGKTEVDGTNHSQYLSALLLSLPCASHDSEIQVKKLQERPYADMTLQWLDQQQIRYQHQRHPTQDVYCIAGNQHYQPFSATITGDFSSASYLIAAAVMLPAKVTLSGLDMADLQGDKQLIPILQAMGANITIAENSLLIEGGQPLTGMSIDASDIPDLLPTLAVLGTYATGKTRIRQVKHARIKETDRIHSMMTGLMRMGARVEEHADGLTIYHGALHGAEVQGYDDHRTVMALSIAGMLASGETKIAGADAIEKTFPQFVELMRSLGANIHASR